MTAVIVVTYGRMALAETTIRTLIATKDDDVRLIVVDNGSTGQMPAMLMMYKHDIDALVLLDHNYGKPYAWNLGAAMADTLCKAEGFDRKPDYLLFSDGDVLYEDNWHHTLKTTYEAFHPLGLGCLSGVVWPPQPQNTTLQTEGDSTISWFRNPPGCCIFMAHEVFDSVGLFDASVKIRCVDTSYYARARDRGFRQGAVWHSSAARHLGKDSRTWDLTTGQPLYRP